MIINVFIENIFGNFELDEVQIYNDVNKMADFIFHNNDLIKSSCLADYKFNTISFDIVFCSNDEIRKINKDYRNKDCATDVITFAIFSDPFLLQLILFFYICRFSRK